MEAACQGGNGKIDQNNTGKQHIMIDLLMKENQASFLATNTVIKSRRLLIAQFKTSQEREIIAQASACSECSV
jgi:hypothetical protein